jgi:hypothetical protein
MANACDHRVWSKREFVEVSEVGWMFGDEAHGARLLDAARAGDSVAFGHLVDSFRAELQAHCCRIVGATHDADDVTQEG